jgi:hypothetical protein
MEQITLNQAREALTGFCINHSHYNFWHKSSEETILYNDVKALKHKLELLIARQEKIINEALPL